MPSNDFLFYMEFIIDLTFIIDVFLNFNTGLYDKNKLIMNRLAIAKDYIKIWFWIDLVSSIPYTWIMAYTMGITIK